MQWQIDSDSCAGIDQLRIIQDQGDNTPTIIIFPYDVTDFTFTGTIKFPTPISLSLGSGITVDNILSCTGAISNTTLTVSAVASGAITLGLPISGNNILPGTVIASFGTGSGGVGTYIVSQNQNVTSTNIVTSQVSMQLTSEQTQDVPEGQYPFDLWTTSPGNVNTDPITGYFVINPALTRIT